ncbi:MAG: hypothetical protein JWM10_4557 [Myxococcaceae bacterium]|nr:hypothetical protein [Myxococcaceae bacterium]
MNRPLRPVLFALAALAAGCGSSSNAADAGGPDVLTPVDSGTPDVPTPVDSGTPDSGTPDVPTPVDNGTPDVFIPDAGTPDSGTPPQARPMRVAYVQYDASGRPSLWVQQPDATGRRQLHFTGIVDDVPAQDPNAPTVTDEHVRSVHRLAWSPDGVHLAAIVSTAIDQSEVVVLDADAGGGAVVSANGQYVMPALDWSADGGKLAYVMATQPHAGALDLFVTDTRSHRWTRVTTGANLRGLGVQLRFVPDAAAVVVSRVEDQGTSAPWDWHQTLLRVDVATGARPTVESAFTGRVDGMSRDLSAVYMVRNRADGGHALVARGVATSSADATLVDDAAFSSADVTPRDGTLLLTHDASGGAGSAWTYRVLRLPDVTTRVDVPAAAERLAVWADPDR